MLVPLAARAAARQSARASRCWALALLACLAPTPALASSEDETTRWVPSLALSFDVVGQKGRGAVESSLVRGTPLTLMDPEGDIGCLNSGSNQRRGTLCPDGATFIAPLQLQPNSESGDTNVVPLVGASFELMTPRLFDALLSPRVFAHGDFSAAFGFERNLTGTETPGDFEPPEQRGFNNIEENTVVGQGTRVRVQTQRWIVSAGVGLAFTFEAFGRRLRVKPSVEYLRQGVDLIGTARRAVKQETIADPTTLDQFRLIALDVSDEITLHGFGPGLEIEADTARLGPLQLSIFLSGRGYYFPSSTDKTLTRTNSDPDGCDLSGVCESASFRYELEPWAWRGGVGLRFRWLPE